MLLQNVFLEKLERKYLKVLALTDEAGKIKWVICGVAGLG